MNGIEHYHDSVRDMAHPASDEEKKIEMLAMFLCDSHIITLGPSGDGHRLSGGHGWHRTSEEERNEYRKRAAIAYQQIDKTKISA